MDKYDLIALVGVAALAAGLWLVWPPLALVVTGLVLIALGLLGARAKTRGQ